MKLKYDGNWPDLCGGRLVVTLEDGRVFDFGRCLSSKGSVYFTNDYREEHVEEGPWEVNRDKVPDDFPKDRFDELVELVNEQVPHGCCGGCL